MDTPLVNSQLVLRTGDSQLVVGTPLAAHTLAEVAERTLAHSPAQATTAHMWARTCQELTRLLPEGSRLSLSVPAQAGVPTVWVSEIEPRQFVVTADAQQDASWVVIQANRDTRAVESVEP